MFSQIRVGITAKLLIPFVSILVLAIAVLGTTFLRAQDAALSSALERKAEVLARNLANGLRDSLSMGEYDQIQQTLENLKKTDQEVEYAILVGMDGKGVASTDRSLRNQSLNRDDFEAAALAVRDFTRRDTPTPGIFEVALPVAFQGNQLGILRMGFSTRRVMTITRPTRWIILEVGSLALFGGVVVYLHVARRVVRPLLAAVQRLEELARGDVDVGRRLVVSSKDEAGQLARAMNTVLETLHRLVQEIKETAVGLEMASERLTDAATQVSTGAQEQAASAEQTSASMTQMAASIQTVAGGAKTLATYVEDTSTSITQMGTSIQEVAKSSSLLAETVTDAASTTEEMTQSLDRMATNLEEFATTVTETSRTIETMASSIQAVTRNTEVLSLAASQASQMVSEMAGAVKEVAKIAIEADRFSQTASQDARTGDEAVAQTVKGMKTISNTMENTARAITGLGKRSQEIGKILEVIEEIADQTNLLALNAAIEAARAGGAGRGFAVVADEVRKLAERSVEATKEIGELIRQVQQETSEAVETANAAAVETKEGIGLADRAGLALRRILESVTRSSQLMGQIAAATAKQSQASADVLDTVSNMNSATSQVTTAVWQQAEGSKQIREAMERINRIMTYAAASTKEQAAGGRQVRLAVENMNKIASQMNLATKQQADGSRQIIHTVENMNRMTQQVSYATAEQRRGGEIVVKAMENISAIAHGNLSAVKEMSHSAKDLAEKAENLGKLVAVFRVRSERVAPSPRAPV